MPAEITFTEDTLRYINLFEAVTKTRVKDCMETEEKLVFGADIALRRSELGDNGVERIADMNLRHGANNTYGQRRAACNSQEQMFHGTHRKYTPIGRFPTAGSSTGNERRDYRIIRMNPVHPAILPLLLSRQFVVSPPLTCAAPRGRFRPRICAICGVGA